VVTDVAHGAAAGDYVKFSSAVSLGGLVTAAVLNHEYVIDALGDLTDSTPDDIYRITARDVGGTEVTANASDTGDGGAATTADYQINSGANHYIPALGWGGGGWGVVPWGGGGAVAFSQQLRLWSQTEFGDDLIINPRGGGIYKWVQADDWSTGDVTTITPGTDYATRATVLTDSGKFADTSDAPTVALQVMLSPVDKHLVVFGTNDISGAALDPLLVRWADQESSTIWTPTATNSSGGQLLSSGNAIVGATKTRQEILIFTDTSIHAMRFVGDPFVFQFAVISENVTSIAPNAAVAVGDAVFFMSDEGFYVYRGAVERLSCDLLDHVFNNADETQLFKSFAVHNPNDSEVWWFYPVTGSPAEISHYVIYNYQENHWTPGTFDRGAWTQALTRNDPISGSNDLDNLNTQYLYNQEKDYDADGSEMNEFLESGLFEVPENGDGEWQMYISRVLNDFKFIGNTGSSDVLMTIKTTDYPQVAPTSAYTSTVTSTTTQSDVRTRSRMAALRWDGNGLGYGWTMGDPRVDAKRDGRL
jgi:hypothetical protein